MRIFHLVPNLNYGGLQKVVRLLAECQLKAGHSVTIGCWTNLSNNLDTERDLQKAGAEVVYLRRSDDGGIIYGYRSLLGILKTQLARQNTELLHVHNPFEYYIYGVLAARAAGGIRVVNTTHATAMFDHPRYGRKGRTKFWISAMLSDGIVSCCEEVETYLRGRFTMPGKRFFVVDNGIDLSPFVAVPARQERNEIVFGLAARMTIEKNHRGLLDAFAQARRRHSNIRLRLLGGGPLEPDLKQQALNLGLNEAVEFCGFSSDVAGFLSGLDVYILPSSTEALPMSLLEAIASGLPVVATPVGGVPRIVKTTDSGWLCASDSADSILAGMESAIAASDRREKGESARQRVLEQYSVERMARDYERLYADVCR